MKKKKKKKNPNNSQIARIKYHNKSEKKLHWEEKVAKFATCFLQQLFPNSFFSQIFLLLKDISEMTNA